MKTAAAIALVWVGAACASDFARADEALPPAFDAAKLRKGRFTYKVTQNGKDLGQATIEIRRQRSGEYRIRFDSKDVAQSWSSTFDAQFKPIDAELHMPARKEPYHMSLRYSATEVSGEETRGKAKAPVSAQIAGQVVDQRVDWAAMMAADISERGLIFRVYDPGSAFSDLVGMQQKTEPFDSVLGRQPAILLRYTIQKKDHAENYLLYATESLPRVMLREDMPNGLVAELVAVEE